VSFTPHTGDEIREMLARVGKACIDDLFESIPAGLRARATLDLPEPRSEPAVLGELRALAARNFVPAPGLCFAGAGAYAHFIPAAVDALAARGEFATTYTPYQAEIAQGTLQWIFEFQTLICQLTGLEVANASLYDGASATAEAALMALRTTRRTRLLVSTGLHPAYRRVLETYANGLAAKVETLPLAPDGRTLAAALPADAAGVVVQSPNVFGCVEDLRPFAAAAREVGALSIQVTNEPLALALLRPPGESGCDLACGEAQAFGVPLSFGGPYVGFLAAREKHLRQLPGRLIGETVDADGRRAFVMTLTTREQHIRREKATSNICTNQGLMALRATIYLALLGRRGLRRLAEANLALAAYARERCRAAGLALPYAAPVFNEFVVRVPDLAARFERLLAQGVLPGVPLSRFDPARDDELLVCATECSRRADIDRLVAGLAA
jgi:glycine dehydrogenase subunit 1